MSTPTNPRKERPSTYFVQDRSNEEELTRMTIQGRLVTDSMGGVLPEQADAALFRRVLDVGCGAGDWLIEAAKLYPGMPELVGVDVSSRMVEYAQAQAEAEQVGDRVRFRVMDALLMLEFPDNYFDLVNQRFGASYLRTWDWSKLLQEYLRVTQPGGVIRVTEGSLIIQSPSPALTRLYEIALDAFYRAGHYFTLESNGVTDELARLLHQSGFQNVQTRTHMVQYRAGTAEWQLFYVDMKRLFQSILPFFRKWSRVPEDYEAIYQRALVEMQLPDFVAKSSLLTAWGSAPLHKE
jgi:ubiquinone/menaquinone biosynthesis C-methylase UbiE